MLDGIGSLGPLRGASAPPPSVRPPSVENDRTFKEILKDSIDGVNRLQQEADRVLEKYAKGEASPDEVTIAFKKSQIAFELLLQVRNKLVDAFQEIQRMRI